MEDILGRAKSLGIEFAEEEKEDLEHLSELQELLGPVAELVGIGVA